ncbi:unnamed protein product [Brachionus calyciflorus]|uniref:Uncharacterized protein n=1 Tax=Brachionus calyciflorus TaxID=104777 RepID=A0A813Q2H8_9BILA|nr:unnamed protein product [Brachionus calyciflorus]
MSTELNPKFNENMKSNLQIKLQNDILAFKKVLKWANLIRNRIETTLKQLDLCESQNESLSNQKLMNQTTTLIDKKIDESFLKKSNRTQNGQINRINEDKYLSRRSENQLLKNGEMKISVQDQLLNPTKVDIDFKPVKSVQIDLKNFEKMVDSLLSQRHSGFVTRVDEIESKFTENQKIVSILSNDIKFVKINLNQLDDDVKEITNNISRKIDKSHMETYRELEKIFSYLKT